jgi:putative membrane protein
MINYDTKAWISSLFFLKKGDTLRKLYPIILLMIVYTGLISYVELDYFHVSDKSNLKNFNTLHTILGFVLSMLLVFRTNTAYDRWWEGRKQWGSLVNSSRNFSAKINAFLAEDDHVNRDFFRSIIPVFSQALYQHLRKDTTRLELDHEPHPEIPNFNHDQHVPNAIIQLLMDKVNSLYMEGKLTDAQLIIINNELQSFLEICGACERIKNTPLPYSYSGFIKKFIFLFVITLPIGMSFTLGYLSIPIVAIIFYVLASLELIAEEIEDPFGNDPNDLPTQIIAEKIEKNVDEIIE